MPKIKIGLLFGTLAGIIDLIPMIIQKLSWDANLSALSFWIVAGIVIAVSDIKIKGAVKGVVLSLLLLVPITFLVGWQQPASLIPMVVMNIILGAAAGLLIEKFSQ
ncbi:MAG: hypothetical protein PHN39_00800 [Candidatus Pacebacteria bacterium]|nr:hypothetical protein [Candidatus Paceibacterota bacterium]